ncbi:unnamed protein product [Calypogeia fissa]
MTSESYEAEKPWEQRVYDDDDENIDGTPACAGHTHCFCQQLTQNVFLRKLERAADIHFDWRTFCKEFVYHTFFPLSLPLMIVWEGGMIGIINRQFWGSRLSAVQWFLSACFFMLNCLTPLYVSPDLVIVDILWVLRNMILATKYGFINKGEMHEMKQRVLPMQVHMDRTLVLAWTNPIPLRVIKRELLLSAVRKDQIRCTSALHLVRGASNKTVQSIMDQLSSKSDKQEQFDYSSPSPSPGEGSGWGRFLDAEFGFNQNFRPCPDCIRHGCTKSLFEDRWIDLSICKISSEPGMLVPKDASFTATDESTHSSHRSDSTDDKACVALDLPALLVAAYIIQRAGDLLKKKNFLHQIFSSPWKVFWASAAVAFVRSVVPFATRAITGKPSTFGGAKWYNAVISISSFCISYSAMSASVMFMLAGSADFRRRYFTARLLNTMLKDGWYGDEKLHPKKREKLKQLRLLQQKSVYHLGLTVDFTDPQSIAGWWAARVLVQDFGMVFYMRVKQYASYFAIYCALLMAFLIVELFAEGARTNIYILAIVVYDLVVFLFLLCLMVFPGGAANDMNHEHGATLTRKKMQISNQMHCAVGDINPLERKILAVAFDLLQTISQAVYWDNSINKVTILGFTAGGELIAVLVGVGSAAIGIAAQQLTSKINN